MWKRGGGCDALVGSEEEAGGAQGVVVMAMTWVRTVEVQLMMNNYALFFFFLFHIVVLFPLACGENGEPRPRFPGVRETRCDFDEWRLSVE